MGYRRARSLDKNLIFAEYFNSEQEVRRNGGIISNAEFEKGVAKFNGTNSYISINKYNVPRSVRVKVSNVIDDTSDILSLKGVVRVILNNSGQFGASAYDGVSAPSLTGVNGIIDSDIILTWSNSRFYLYINGVLEDDGALTNYPAFETYKDRGDYVGSNYLGTSLFYNGNVELIELYNKELTPEEVTNLYNNARYVLPNLEHGEQLDESITINSGYDGTTDWIDTDGNGYADGWEELSASYPCNASIVQGNGFIGNAQRVEEDNGISYSSATNRVNLVIGELYRITGKYRSSNNLNLHKGSGPFYFQLPANTGDAVYFSRIFRTTELSWYISTIQSNGWIEIDEIKISKIIVPETKKILHVTAKDGVVRNLMSGDSVTKIYNDVSEVDFTDGWIGVNSPVLTPNSWTGNNAGVYEPAKLIVGRHYKITVEGTATEIGVLSCPNISGGGSLSVSAGSFSNVFKGFQTTNGNLYIYCTGNQTITFTKIRIEEVVPEAVVNNVEVARNDVMTPRFLDASSNINFGTYNDLIGDVTILVWINASSLGGASQGMIIENGKLRLALVTPDKVRFTSNGSIYRTMISPITFKDWYFVAIQRKEDGDCALTLDGEGNPTYGSTGTPEVGIDDIKVGNRDAGTTFFDGLISEVIVLKGLLMDKEISQYYTSTKHKYNK